MRKNSIKNTRINSEVQRELSSIISRELKDPRIHPMTTVVSVEVTPDLKYCKAYISVLGNEADFAVGGRSPGLDGEADRTGTLLPSLQGKPDNGGNRYHSVKYGGSSGGGRGGVPRLRVWKKVFSRVYLP